MLGSQLLSLSLHSIASRRNPNFRRLTSTIIVGYQEKHEVTYDLNHWESIERVYIDRVLTIEKPMLFHLERVSRIDFIVGFAEQHRLRIEFEMSTADKSVGQKQVRMYVDDYLIDTKSA